MAGDDAVLNILQGGGIAVLRTDTLYGIVARADDARAVARVFEVKQRDTDKPLIVLLAHSHDAWDGGDMLESFSHSERPTSVIIDSPHAPSWLRHHDGTVAYRVPASPELRALLAETGPLVAPSANPQGLPPARTVQAAKAYFDDAVDYYTDGGEVPTGSPASRIIRVAPDGTIDVIRD